jgi:hypothetical protein
MKPLSTLIALALITLLASQLSLPQSQKGQAVLPIVLLTELKLTQKDFPSDAGELSVGDIRTDSKGDLRFLDQKGNRVWRFSRERKCLSVFDIIDAEKQKPIYAVKLIIDSKDNIYVLDGYGKNVFVFDGQGKFIRKFMVKLMYPQPHLLNGVLGPQDQLILGGYLDGKIIPIFDGQGNLIRSLGETVSREQARAGEASTQAMFYSNGFLYYALMTHYELRKLDVANDKIVSTLTPPDFQWGSFTVFLSIIVTPDGDVLNFRRTGKAEFIDRFTKEGKYV